jgi:hypothetical protein
MPGQKMEIQPFQSPEKSGRRYAARISDERLYALLGIAIDNFKTFNSSSEVRGGSVMVVVVVVVVLWWCC